MRSKFILGCFVFVAVTVFLSKCSEKEDDQKLDTEKVIGSLTYKSYPGERERNVESEKLTFKKFVYHRHSERLQAVKNVLKLKYDKQYEILEKVLPTMFEVILDSRLILESSGYIPGEDWPLNMTVRDAMAQTIENTLYFGEMVLRLPDITHRIMKKHKEWQILIQWSWFFSKECLPFLHEKLHEPINLMAQELGIVSKDPMFYNQFKLENQIQDTPTHKNAPKTRENKKRKPKEKGPTMTSATTGEL